MNTRIRYASLAIALSLATLQAAAQTWTGGGADNNWSTGANWVGGVPPASGPATVLTFPPSARFSPVVDAPWTVNRLSFQVAYTLSGQALTFSGAAPGIDVAFRATIDNPIILTGPTGFATLQVMDLNGGISGTGPVTFNAVGGIALRGISTYTGGTTIAVGSLALLGTMPGPVTVFAGGAGLFGTNGIVTGPVIVNTGASISGTLATGDLTISGTHRSDINGPAPGQYGSIAVTGVVTLNNAPLLLGGSYAPAENDTFTLIDNDGADPVVGTYAGLAEGSLVTVNGVLRRLSYVGGTGNDVTLGTTIVGVPQPTPTLSQWALILLAAAMLGMGLMSSRRGTAKR